MIIKRLKNEETLLKLYMIMTATHLLYVYENLTLLRQPEKRAETAEINFFVSCRMWPKHEGRNQVTKYIQLKLKYCWLQMAVDTIFIKKYCYRYSQGSVRIHSGRRNIGQQRKSGEITTHKDRLSWYSLATDELWQCEVKVVPVFA